MNWSGRGGGSGTSAPPFLPLVAANQQVAYEGASGGDAGQDGTDGKTVAGGGKFLGCGNPEVCHAHLLHVGDLGDGEVDGVGLEVALGASLSVRV